MRETIERYFDIYEEVHGIRARHQKELEVYQKTIPNLALWADYVDVNLVDTSEAQESYARWVSKMKILYRDFT